MRKWKSRKNEFETFCASWCTFIPRTKEHIRRETVEKSAAAALYPLLPENAPKPNARREARPGLLHVASSSKMRMYHHISAYPLFQQDFCFPSRQICQRNVAFWQWHAFNSRIPTKAPKRAAWSETQAFAKPGFKGMLFKRIICPNALSSVRHNRSAHDIPYAARENTGLVMHAYWSSVRSYHATCARSSRLPLWS